MKCLRSVMKKWVFLKYEKTNFKISVDISQKLVQWKHVKKQIVKTCFLKHLFKEVFGWSGNSIKYVWE